MRFRLRSKRNEQPPQGDTFQSYKEKGAKSREELLQEIISLIRERTGFFVKTYVDEKGTERRLVKKGITARGEPFTSYGGGSGGYDVIATSNIVRDRYDVERYGLGFGITNSLGHEWVPSLWAVGAPLITNSKDGERNVKLREWLADQSGGDRNAYCLILGARVEWPLEGNRSPAFMLSLLMDEGTYKKIKDNVEADPNLIAAIYSSLFPELVKLHAPIKNGKAFLYFRNSFLEIARLNESVRDKENEVHSKTTKYEVV